MECRVCGGKSFSPVLDLGMHPWCNDFLTQDRLGTEPVYPLTLIYCNDCCTSQLDYTVKKEVMFGDHTYLSGITSSLRSHFQAVADSVDREFTFSNGEKSVLDIGSNDGTQLQCFQSLGYEVLGVESSKTTAKIAIDNDVPTVNKFFNFELAETLDKKFNVINAAGVFFHLEELHSVCDGIKLLLNEDGVFVVQFLYMKSIMENLAFDQIYHEHLLYYTLETIQKLLGLHGMEMFDARLCPIHGGTIVGYVCHKEARLKTKRFLEMLQSEREGRVNDLSTYQNFASEVQALKDRTINDLRLMREQGKRIFGLGAPVKGNTILNYMDIGVEMVELLTERNPLRDGLYSPGKHIPIVMEEELETQPDVYFVLAWNFKKEILERNQLLISSGVEFYFPIDPKEIA